MTEISLFNSPQFPPTRKSKAKKILMLALFGLAMAALATPPLGFIVNQLLAKGATFENISEHVQMAKNLDGSVEPWQVQLQAQGSTDSYVQHLVLAPGGYSGWHTHPGILIGTLVSGSIDFYNANCQKRSLTAGQMYFEDENVHAIINTGGVNADLYITYLIKHGAPRRMEADAPACAPSTGIP